MENNIMQCNYCKLTEFMGSFRLYAYRVRNYDGIPSRDYQHVMTFYTSGYIRNEITGTMYDKTRCDDYNAYEEAVKAYFAECDRAR